MAEIKEYHIKEISNVTDEELEKTINNELKEGWIFESVYFAMREASKRPAMAFIFFVKK